MTTSQSVVISISLSIMNFCKSKKTPSYTGTSCIKKASHLWDALNLLNEADLLKYRVSKYELGKKCRRSSYLRALFPVIEEQRNDRKHHHPLRIRRISTKIQKTDRKYSYKLNHSLLSKDIEEPWQSHPRL